VTLTCDLFTLKVVSELRVTWATSVPILVFLGLSVLDLGTMYATDRRQTSDRQTDVRQHHRLMPPPIRGGGIKQTNGAYHYARSPLYDRELSVRLMENDGLLFVPQYRGRNKHNSLFLPSALSNLK